MAVLNDRSDATADCSAGLNGSTPAGHHGVKNETANVKQQHGDRISEPMPLTLSSTPPADT